MSTCGVCGGPMDPSRATYDKMGNLVCPACAAKATIAEGDQRAVSSTTGAAIGVIVGGVLSVTCFNPFLIVSIITLASGAGWLLMVARNPAHRAKMGGKFVFSLIAVLIGMCLAALPVLFVALGMTAFMLRR